jgi:Ni/Fe-hydrogenase 1 B-type cytochrome subunit
MYLVFYLALIGASITGLMMFFDTELGISSDMHKGIEALHLGIVTLIIYFVPLHLIGVVMAELGNEPGIISKMINGGGKKKDKP